MNRAQKRIFDLAVEITQGWQPRRATPIFRRDFRRKMTELWEAVQDWEKGGKPSRPSEPEARAVSQQPEYDLPT